MISKKIYIYLFGGILFFLWQGCVKEDLSKISSDFDWKAGISLPLSAKIITSQDYVGIQGLVDDYLNSGGWGVVLTTYSSFDFSDIYKQSDYVDSMMLRYEISNNFPAQLKMGLYFMDESTILMNALEHLPLEMEAPELDENGELTTHPYVVVDQWFSGDDLLSLMDAKKVAIRIIMSDMDVRDVVTDQLDAYSMDVHISLRSVVTIPLDEL